MPIITVPTAPIPVQTAYAVPIGSVCVALNNNTILKARLIKKPINHNAAFVPEVSFTFPRQVVNPISKSPAIINMIQFIKVFKYTGSPNPKHGKSLRKPS